MKYLKTYEFFDFFKKKKEEDYALTKNDSLYLEETINGMAADFGLPEFEMHGGGSTPGIWWGKNLIKVRFTSNIEIGGINYKMVIFPVKINEYHLEFNQHHTRSTESDFHTMEYTNTVKTPKKAMEWFLEISKDPNSKSLKKYKF